MESSPSENCHTFWYKDGCTEGHLGKLPGVVFSLAALRLAYREVRQQPLCAIIAVLELPGDVYLCFLPIIKIIQVHTEKYRPAGEEKNPSP